MSDSIDDVWRAICKFDEHMQRRARAREVWAAIQKAESTCGSCEKWMTNDCPREVLDNRRGHKVGPNCNSPKCGEFVMKQWDAQRIAALREEHAALSAA